MLRKLTVASSGLLAFGAALLLICGGNAGSETELYDADGDGYDRTRAVSLPLSKNGLLVGRKVETRGVRDYRSGRDRDEGIVDPHSSLTRVPSAAGTHEIHVNRASDGSVRSIELPRDSVVRRYSVSSADPHA